MCENLIKKFRLIAYGKNLITFHQEVCRFNLNLISRISWIIFTEYLFYKIILIYIWLSKVAFGINTGAINDPKAPLNELLSKFFEGLNLLLLDPSITVCNKPCW